MSDEISFLCCDFNVRFMEKEVNVTEIDPVCGDARLW